MIGIYKIQNKLNGKIYIGQSIHCGKRLDEHCKGKSQFIDQMIEFDGIENYTFEILKQVSVPELCYWEDYYIIKYNTMYPNGYNKKWNCNEEIRFEIQEKIDKEKQREEELKEQTEEAVDEIKAFRDDVLWVEHFFDYKLFSLYCFLLKNSVDYGDKRIVCAPYYRKNTFCYTAIEKDIKISNGTVKKYIEILQDNKLIVGDTIVELIAISEYFDYKDFDSQKLFSNMILWYITKENKFKKNYYFYKQDFQIIIKRQAGNDKKMGMKTYEKISEILEFLNDRKCIRMETTEKQNELKIIALNE